MNDAAQLSVVIPVHNEAGAIKTLVSEIKHVLAQEFSGFEILCVDDGSTDGGCERLVLQSRLDPRFRVIRCADCQGQSAAVWIGFHQARGEIIVTLDGDGQNDPRDIPRMVAGLEEYDMVVGHRVKRYDVCRKRVFSRAGNALRNWLTGSNLPDSGCGLKVFHKTCVASFIPFRGMHRYLPTFVEMAGGRVKSMEVGHRPRGSGQSHYGVLDRTMTPFLDCLALAWLRHRRFREGLLTSVAKNGNVVGVSNVIGPIDRADYSRQFRVDVAESVNELAPEQVPLPQLIHDIALAETNSAGRGIGNAHPSTVVSEIT